MESLPYLLCIGFGYLLRKYQPNLSISRAQDFSKPMAEYIEPDIEEVAKYTRKSIL